MSSVLLQLLSGLPAIFQDFLGVETSFPHTGHLAIRFPFQALRRDENKTFSIRSASKMVEFMNTPSRRTVSGLSKRLALPICLAYFFVRCSLGSAR